MLGRSSVGVNTQKPFSLPVAVRKTWLQFILKGVAPSTNEVTPLSCPEEYTVNWPLMVTAVEAPLIMNTHEVK